VPEVQEVLFKNVVGYSTKMPILWRRED
jgi:hypothetical protein